MEISVLKWRLPRS